MTMILKEPVWLTADKSRAVPAGDPEAVHLLGMPGSSVGSARAAALGLMRGCAPQGARSKSLKRPVEDKALHQPVEDKGGIDYKPAHRRTRRIATEEINHG